MSEKVRHPEKVNKPINPIKKKPEWIRSKIIDTKIFFKTKQVVNQNNLVTVSVKGNHQISNIKIDDGLQSSDLRDIEKHVLIASNEALAKVNKEIKAKMGSMMNLPGGFKLPF